MPPNPKLYTNTSDAPLVVEKTYEVAADCKTPFVGCKAALQCFVGNHGYDINQDVLAVVELQDITHRTPFEVFARKLRIVRLIDDADTRSELLDASVRIGVATDYKKYTRGKLHATDGPAVHRELHKSVLGFDVFCRLTREACAGGPPPDGQDGRDGSVKSRLWDIALFDCEVVVVAEWFHQGSLNRGRDQAARQITGFLSSSSSEPFIQQMEWWFSGRRHRDAHLGSAFCLSYVPLSPRDTSDCRILSQYPAGFHETWIDGRCTCTTMPCTDIVDWGEPSSDVGDGDGDGPGRFGCPGPHADVLNPPTLSSVPLAADNLPHLLHGPAVTLPPTRTRSGYKLMFWHACVVLFLVVWCAIGWSTCVRTRYSPTRDGAAHGDDYRVQLLVCWGWTLFLARGMRLLARM